MPRRSFCSFRPAPSRVEDPPSPDTLFTAFLSSLSVDEGAASAVLYGAAVRHFLHWLELRGIIVGEIDDGVARRFEKHRCRCAGYCAQEPDYKADLAARVRRFIRYLEDQSYIIVADGIDELGRHFADYSDNIDDLQLAPGVSQSYRSEAEHCQRRSKSRPFGGVKPGHRVTYRGEWREGVARGPLPPALV